MTERTKEECSFPDCRCLKWCAVKIGVRVPDRKELPLADGETESKS